MKTLIISSIVWIVLFVGLLLCPGCDTPRQVEKSVKEEQREVYKVTTIKFQKGDTLFVFEVDGKKFLWATDGYIQRVDCCNKVVGGKLSDEANASFKKNLKAMERAALGLPPFIAPTEKSPDGT